MLEHRRNDVAGSMFPDAEEAELAVSCDVVFKPGYGFLHSLRVGIEQALIAADFGQDRKALRCGKG
jgi:hypothetical protein